MSVPTIVLAGLSTTAITVGVAVAARRLFGYAQPTLSDSVLNRQEQALVLTAADAFFPPGGPIPVSGREAGILRYIDGYVRRAQRMQRILMHLLFAFTELSPLMFGPRRARFTKLNLDEQRTFLHGMFASQIYFRRIAFTSLRAMMTMAYCANAEVCRTMGMTFDTDPYGIGEVVLEQRPEGATP